MASKKELDQQEQEAVAILVEEQKRDYDYLLHIYNRLRATEGLLLTAAFGIVAYLYYGASDGDKPGIAERLFVPAEDYGKVIYFMAAAFFLYGILKLMMNVFGNNPWMTAYVGASKESIYKPKDATPLEVIKYVRCRYDECQEFNVDKYNKRKNDLGFLFYCILISAIILIVIKTLG